MQPTDLHNRQIPFEFNSFRVDLIPMDDYPADSCAISSMAFLLVQVPAADNVFTTQ